MATTIFLMRIIAVHFLSNSRGSHVTRYHIREYHTEAIAIISEGTPMLQNSRPCSQHFLSFSKEIPKKWKIFIEKSFHPFSGNFPPFSRKVFKNSSKFFRKQFQHWKRHFQKIFQEIFLRMYP